MVPLTSTTEPLTSTVEPLTPICDVETSMLARKACVKDTRKDKRLGNCARKRTFGTFGSVRRGVDRDRRNILSVAVRLAHLRGRSEVAGRRSRRVDHAGHPVDLDVVRLLLGAVREPLDRGRGPLPDGLAVLVEEAHLATNRRRDKRIYPGRGPIGGGIRGYTRGGDQSEEG
eukprot:1194575-Prorocentrum_minimum.AAC.4